MSKNCTKYEQSFSFVQSNRIDKKDWDKGGF